MVPRRDADTITKHPKQARCELAGLSSFKVKNESALAAVANRGTTVNTLPVLHLSKTPSDATNVVSRRGGDVQSVQKTITESKDGT